MRRQTGDGSLVPYEKVKRDHDSGFGPSSTMRTSVFPEVMTSKQPLLVPDVVMDPRYADDYAIMNCIRSVIVVPFLVDDDAIGVLYAHQTPRSLKDGRHRGSSRSRARTSSCASGWRGSPRSRSVARCGRARDSTRS